MPNGKYLLDTNIVIALMAGDRNIRQCLEEAEEVFLSTVVFGELCYGAQNSARAESNMLRLRELATTITILPCTIETAIHYGHIKNSLRRKGRPLPENDIWIAACAMHNNLVLISRDEHFTHINNLQLERW